MRFLPSLPLPNSLAFVLVVILATATNNHIVGASRNNISNLRRLPSSLAFATASPPLRTSLSFRPSSVVVMHASNERSEDGFQQQQQLPASGSFFHQVPPPKEDGINSNSSNDDGGGAAIEGTIGESLTSVSSSISNEFGFGDGDLEIFQQIVRKTRLSTKGSGSGGGFAKKTPTSDYTSPSIIRTTRKDTSTGDSESFVGIGMPLNNVNNPEYDKDGYTLYADEVTGEKRRVFEALVEYPSVFKMKIVGSDGDDIQQQQQQKNDDHDKIENDEESNNTKLLFAPSIVKVVAESCGVDVSAVQHTIRRNGKWISVTVYAPVQNADMLYSLYENVDKDPRVKFKF